MNKKISPQLLSITLEVLEISQTLNVMEHIKAVRELQGNLFY